MTQKKRVISGTLFSIVRAPGRGRRAVVTVIEEAFW